MTDTAPFDLDRRQIRAAFERAAPRYDSAAGLQREIADRLLARLDLIHLAPRAILDAGSGTGYCARALARRYRGARTVGLDLATAMLRAARRRERWWRRRGWVCGDIERLPFAAASFDLVLSNLALQWCDPLRAFGEFHRVLRPGGLLLFTSFGPDTLGELRAAWAAVDPYPHVHGFLDMHDLGDALVRGRFADPVMDCERLVVTYPGVGALLRELKHIGAHNAARGRHSGLTGKQRFARFRAAYETLARDGRIPASYEVVYGHAWAPAAGARPELHKAVVPLDRIGRRR
jgi:malonyl-CoA O-methyltransferase